MVLCSVLALDVTVLGVTSKLCLQPDALLACEALSEFFAAFESDIGDPTAAHEPQQTTPVSVSINICRRMMFACADVCESAYAGDNLRVVD